MITSTTRCNNSIQIIRDNSKSQFKWITVTKSKWEVFFLGLLASVYVKVERLDTHPKQDNLYSKCLKRQLAIRLLSCSFFSILLDHLTSHHRTTSHGSEDLECTMCTSCLNVTISTQQLYQCMVRRHLSKCQTKNLKSMVSSVKRP